ncbi:transcriptional regulator [Streptomyces sp. NPDC060194]|uniref:transcriptional regulator n=1 Tax=Streptomyces sp. NPDC060194 TaxID=3347069 RepID=UPI00364990FF
MSPDTGSKPTSAIAAGPGERLVQQLTHLLPAEAAVVRVRLLGPHTLWPHLRLTAVTECGHAVRVPRAKALTMARWIIRSFPHAGWADTDGHAFDLRTAQLRGLSA